MDKLNLKQHTVRTIIESHPQNPNNLTESEKGNVENGKEVPVLTMYFSFLPMTSLKQITQETMPPPVGSVTTSVRTDKNASSGSGYCNDDNGISGSSSSSSSSAGANGNTHLEYATTPTAAAVNATNTSNATNCDDGCKNGNFGENDKSLQIQEEKSLLNLLTDLNDTRPGGGGSGSIVEGKGSGKQTSSSSSSLCTVNYDTNDAMNSTFNILQESTRISTRGRQRGEHGTEQQSGNTVEETDALRTPMNIDNDVNADETSRGKDGHNGTQFRIFGFIEEAQMKNGAEIRTYKRKALTDESERDFNTSFDGCQDACLSKGGINENSSNGQDNSSRSHSLGSHDTVETSRVKSVCEEDDYVNFRSDRLVDEASGLSAPVPCNNIDLKVANQKLHSSAEKLHSKSSTTRTKKSRITPIFVAPLGSGGSII